MVAVRPAGPVEAYVEEYEPICVFRGREYVDVEAVRDGKSLVLSGAVHAVDLARAEAWLRDPDADKGELDPRGAASAARRVELVVTETVLRSVVSTRWYDPITKQVVEQYDWEDGPSTTASHVVTTTQPTARIDCASAPRSPSRHGRWRPPVVDAAGRRASRLDVGLGAARPRARPPYYGVGAQGRTQQGLAVGDAVTAAVTQVEDRTGQIPMPAGGANRYLFLVTGPTPLRRDRQPEGRGDRPVRGARDEPNLEFQAVWFTGRGYALPGGDDGLPAHRRPDARLSPDGRPGALRARRRATVAVRTTDSAGRPVERLRPAPRRRREAAGDGRRRLRRPDRPPLPLAAGGLPPRPGRLARGRAPGERRGQGLHDRRRRAATDRLRRRPPDAHGDHGGRRPRDGHLRPARRRHELARGRDRDDRGPLGRDRPRSFSRSGCRSSPTPRSLPSTWPATGSPSVCGPSARPWRPGQPVRFTVSSATLPMAPVTVDGTAFAEVLVALPALTTGTHRVTIAATSDGRHRPPDAHLPRRREPARRRPSRDDRDHGVRSRPRAGLA